jgi:hypothetical protein
MSILTDAFKAHYAAQDAAGAQPKMQIGIDWARGESYTVRTEFLPTGESYTVRTEFLPTASRVSLKRLGKRERILARLKEGPATTWELMQLGGAGFSSRIAELRRDGWNIPAPEMHEDYGVYRLEKSVDEKDRTAL